MSKRQATAQDKFDCVCVGLDGECSLCLQLEGGEIIDDPVLYSSFLRWLEEPSYNGQPNGSHMNTRTTLIAEIAFKAGNEAGVISCGER